MASQQTSSTLMSVIITNARAYLNESSEGFWLNAEMLVWGNDGTLDIAVRTHCLEAVETEELAANTLAYALADPFITIRTVIYNQGSGNEKGLIRGNLQSIGHGVENGIPANWCQDQDNVVVYPKPNSDNSGTGKDIDVYTVSRPAAVAADGNVLVPAYYDKALALYIAAQGFLKDSQFEKAKVFMIAYLAELDRYRVDFITIAKESVEVVK